MQLTYLIKSSDSKERFLDVVLPDDVMRGAVGTYEVDGGELYVLSFSIEGSTILGARELSKLRNRLRDEANVRLPVDGVSLKFANTLYPHFAEYERMQRCTITLATCAEHEDT